MRARQAEFAIKELNPPLPPLCGDLPGADIVAAGLRALADLASGKRREFTVEALLVAVGARRLRAAGLEIPAAPGWPETPELALYAAIRAIHPQDAHSRYNALIRRLVSFERVLEQRTSRSALGGRGDGKPL